MRSMLLVSVFSMIFYGCASNKEILNLAENEKNVIINLRLKIDENKGKVEKAEKNIGELGASYEELNFLLEDSLSKAKRLESMQSFLSSVPDEFRQTQRSVVLYHLYEVEQAEQKVLRARMAERQASVKEITKAYSRLSALLGDALENLELLIRNVNQPKSARILAITDTFLDEVKSFRTSLVESENPRLNNLANRVLAFEERAIQARQDSAETLQTLLSIKGEL